MRKFLIVAVLMVLAGTFAFAATDRNIRAMFYGARPIGMGGAFTAVANDENAMFYNPAGISQREDMLLQFFSFDMYSSNFWTYMDYVRESSASSEDKQQIIRENPSFHISLPNIAFVSGHINPDIENKVNFGIGFFYYIDYGFRYKTEGDKTDLSIKADTTGIVPLPVSYSINIEDRGTLAVGATLKYIFRSRGGITHDDDGYGRYVESDQGKAFGVDLGLLYHINDTGWNFGLMIADVFETQIKYEGGKIYNDDGQLISDESYKEKIPRLVNAGVAYSYYYQNDDSDNRITLALDVSDITNNYEYSDESIDKRLHIGAELKYNIFVLRLGLNSSNPTFGLGLETATMNFGYVLYGEDTIRGENPIWTNRLVVAFKLRASPRKERQSVATPKAETRSYKYNEDIDDDNEKRSNNAEPSTSNNVNNTGNTYNTYNYYNSPPPTTR